MLKLIKRTNTSLLTSFHCGCWRKVTLQQLQHTLTDGNTVCPSTSRNHSLLSVSSPLLGLSLVPCRFTIGNSSMAWQSPLPLSVTSLCLLSWLRSSCVAYRTELEGRERERERVTERLVGEEREILHSSSFRLLSSNLISDNLPNNDVYSYSVLWLSEDKNVGIDERIQWKNKPLFTRFRRKYLPSRKVYLGNFRRKDHLKCQKLKNTTNCWQQLLILPTSNKVFKRYF